MSPGIPTWRPAARPIPALPSTGRGSGVSLPPTARTRQDQEPRSGGPLAGSGTYGVQWRVMQLLADFFPLILFFIAFKWQGIYFATGVAIVASIVQILWLRWKRGRVA